MKPTMMLVDGISFPRAYLLTNIDDRVCLQYREQMCDIDSDGKSVMWKPISGPIPILKDVDLEESRQRLVPKKPIPVEGIRKVIDRLAKHKKLTETSVQVQDCTFQDFYVCVCCSGMGKLF